MAGSVSSTSAMRSAETAARGRVTKITDIIIKAITICMAYCIKAIMSPTCRVDSAIWCAPTQMMPSDRPLMMSVMMGMSTAMARATNSMVLVRSRLAPSKRASSSCCLLNARMTIMPVRCSRITRFRRSIFCWMTRNLGMAMENMTASTPSRAITARAMSHTMLVERSMARITPPMPRIGAYSRMRMMMPTSICTCVTSLVVRVINEAVEKRSNSVPRKDSTFSNTAPRRSRATPEEVREASRPTVMAQALPASEIKSIVRPVRRM